MVLLHKDLSFYLECKFRSTVQVSPRWPDGHSHFLHNHPPFPHRSFRVTQMPRAFSCWHGRRPDPKLFSTHGEPTQTEEAGSLLDIDLHTLVDGLLGENDNDNWSTGPEGTKTHGKRARGEGELETQASPLTLPNEEPAPPSPPEKDSPPLPLPLPPLTAVPKPMPPSQHLGQQLPLPHFSVPLPPPTIGMSASAQLSGCEHQQLSESLILGPAAGNDSSTAQSLTAQAAASGELARRELAIAKREKELSLVEEALSQREATFGTRGDAHGPALTLTLTSTFTLALAPTLTLTQPLPGGSTLQPLQPPGPVVQLAGYTSLAALQYQPPGPGASQAASASCGLEVTATLMDQVTLT